ncbi:MAG: class I SAM-dependent methyltransferase [Chitinophagaceae bacterium]|nr:class I SAM-dependent methyltransferase [Chitinophagaceae bacterium]
MSEFDRQAHWEKIYNTKELNEVSWYQPVPTTSLEYIASCNLSKDASIIDIGGGDSFLVDALLNLGYTNISVLDISTAAIERAKKRLGKKSNLVKWIVTDITNFKPQEQFDCWHDRAAFHFLTSTTEINQYINIVSATVKSKGYLIIGTFSEDGPTKCSGIPIQQYSQENLEKIFSSQFNKIAAQIVDHQTPFNTIQNFVFSSFQRF